MARYRREEIGELLLLLKESATEVGFENLHDGDESLHLVEAAGELGFSSPGSCEPLLRLSQPVTEIFHRSRLVVVVVRRGSGPRRRG